MGLSATLIMSWLAQPAAAALCNVAQQFLLQRLGLSSSPSPTPGVKPLLDDYLQRLTARLDEDRIAKLYGAFSTLLDAPKSVAQHGLLIEALDRFHEVAEIPEQGMTGGRPNAELRCMAFVGMAASHTLLGDRSELIVGKMIEAVYADADTTKRWLGEALVREVIAQFSPSGVICPKCGFQNPAGSRFCNQDGYPLNSDPKSPSPLPSQTSTLYLIRQPWWEYGFRAFQIILDDKPVGVIRQRESFTLEIQPGHHKIFLRVGQYSTSPLTFDITPGEKVTFLCQAGSSGGIRLWKP